MKNMLLPIGLFLLVVLPLTANDLKDRSGPNKPVKDITTIPKIGQDLYIIGPSVDYDAVLVEENAMPARSSYRTNRNLADTLAYVPADGSWNGQFIQSPGDAMLVMFKMPADGIIKAVNVPVYEWGTGDQQMTISLHKVSYPFTTDSTTYPLSAVDGAGWIGGYDMDTSGHMSIEGTTYSAGETVGICDPGDAVVAGAQDPLGTTAGSGPTGVPTMGLVWPDGVIATLNPTDNPGQADNWMHTDNYGAEPTLLQNEWIGVLFHSTGSGGGDDPTTGFYYEAGDGVVDPWVFSKFYHECTGSSGNGGWHIRHWMVNAQLAVELTGDRGPVFGEMTELLTTISTADRSVSVAVTDDNPGDGSAAGVESVTLSYQLNDLEATVNTVNLSLDSGTATDGTWTGSIPGQGPGTFVYWSLTAADVNSNTINTVTNSYFIWEATPGNDLIYNNQDMLYGNLDYAATLYFYWGSVEQTGFDIWDASYGGLTSELLENYDVLVELCGTGPNHIDDDVIMQWWGPDKTYIVSGDEWLGARHGSADGPTPEGSVALDIFGITHVYHDINYYVSGDQNGVSRLMPVENDSVTAALYNFLSDSLYLNYDPNYETGGSNWLDGIVTGPSHTVAMTGYSGTLNSTGSVPASAEEYNVMIYGSNNGKTAFLAFDAIALNTQTATPHDAGYHWIGAHSYQELNVSPLALVYEWLDTVNVTTNIPEINISSENIMHGDTGLVDVSINYNYTELSSIDMSFAGFQGKLDFLEIVADDSSLMGSQGWLIQTNDTDSLLITASAGAQNISGTGKLFSLKFAVPDTLSSQYVHVNLVDFLGNTDIDVAFESNGGVQSVWGPTIGFTTSETVGDYPLTVTFTDTSSAGTFPITTWSWDFGDDSTASGQTAAHTYSLPGIYDVSLNIADEFGLTDTLVYQGLVQLDTIYGDVDWNAQVQSFDASMILKDLVDMIELDDMQVIVADVSTDNTLSTLDATLILQYVVGTISALPYDAGAQYVASGNVSMDDRGTGPGIPINIPLNISNGSNIYGFEMKVEFDHTLLEFDTLVLSELMDNYLLIYNSDTDGELIVAASGGNPDGETGSFGTLTFNVSDNFSDETVVSITRLRWNEGPAVEEPASMIVSYALAIDSELLPDKFALYQNYPNPFNPVTTLRYDLPENGHVNIIVYDMLGREVKRLINQTQDAGYRSVIWNATNDYGKPVSAGIYLYQIQAGEYISTKKMVLLK